MSSPPFHPLVQRWFASRFGQPTAPQEAGWGHIAGGRDTLIAAPTGSGKTLAAFLWTLDRLVSRALDGRLADETEVVYVSPLKALGNDIQKNLLQPLAEIRQLAESSGLELAEIRVAVRSGDTPAHERQQMIRRPPHILITTPESFYILLTARRSRDMLKTARTVIVDEIHAVAEDKRGAHLALSLERLDALARRRLQRIGLSATQNPIEEVARLLVGTERVILNGPPDCAIVDSGHRRELDLRVEVMDRELGPIASHELWGDIYERIVQHAQTHRSTIVFVNTRRLVERVAHQLAERLGKEKVAAHHGSLSRSTRLRAEQGLKSGEIPLVVATASLELGIDIGHVDLVCHLGAPRAIATLLQRVGRSGHWLGATPKGILFPLTRDDLLQCAAAVRAVQRGDLDRLSLPRKPLDILAQQIVAAIASQEMAEEDVWQLVHRAYPFREVSRTEFEQVLEMLSEGVSTRRGRRSAHLHRDRVNGLLKPRRGARLAAITGGGAIPDTADYDVIEEPAEIFVGKVNEDFAIESVAGDIFLLGNRSWRIRRVEAGKMRVIDAEGAPPTIPFWLGESPARTQELSASVAAIRQQVADRLGDLDDAAAWLQQECALERHAAEQLVAYIAETRAALGALPTQQVVIAERFFDEGGGMQLVVHAPFGGRINRAWGLALRKRFCRTFDFELQAAATDDGLVLSLGEQHSFALESVFEMLHPSHLRDDLVHASLASPMFDNRWRWNATRSLALLRHSGGKRVPMPIQRMRAEDLLAAVFPAQLACGDNHPRGEIEPPDHPLVNETVDNCLYEAMDTDGLRSVVEKVRAGEIEARAVDTPAPSPMSHEILNANPYAFLDDAPLEERRARAVSLRRTAPDLAGGVGALDPRAIDEVRNQAWPDVRDADELHDLLLGVLLLPEETADGWQGFVDELRRRRRIARVSWPAGSGFVATERLDAARAALPALRVHDDVPAIAAERTLDAEEAMRAAVNGWMECLGPTTAGNLARFLQLEESQIDAALYRLEADGIVLRGRFIDAATHPHLKSETGNAESQQWCERRLLSRIHRLTLGRLRREIEAVSAADFVRFLTRWQHVHEGTQLHGRDGVLSIITQLQGLELPAPAWEAGVLPSRINLYNPADLEDLCLAGEVAWGRIRLPHGLTQSIEDGLLKTRRGAPRRSAPLAFLRRDALSTHLEPLPESFAIEERLSGAAARALTCLRHNGASFLTDIADDLRMPRAQAEEALWELVALGLVTGDGIAGLRSLLQPEMRRHPLRHLHAVRKLSSRHIPVGRWSLLRRRRGGDAFDEETVEAFARQLLKRWGVVLRELLAREVHAPSWRDLLLVFRRLEARGEIRGGRFVAGFVGEQFALPEAVDALRAVRRKSTGDEVVVVGASDPLNLVGVLTPGGRLSPFSHQVIAYRNGVPAETGELGAVLSRLGNHKRRGLQAPAAL